MGDSNIQNLTENEKDILNGIAYHEMSPVNSAKPECIQDTGTFCWVEDFSNVNLTDDQVKGVLSSLVKKELINISKWDGQDTVVDFTPEGFTAWQSIDDGRRD